MTRSKAGGFRDLRVVAKVRESSSITSFHLEPVDADGWLPFEAGQFLVLRIPAKGDRRAMPRSYSVSSSPKAGGRYRITVKREAAPGPDVPDGAGSCWLHDEIGVGDVISAAGPRGEFFLDGESRRPVALLSGGVGLTPMVAMLHALADGSDRSVHFVHACDSGDVHALRDEVLALSARRQGVEAHFCYRFPTDADRATQRHQSEGVLTAALLARLLPTSVDRDYYLCGPPPFMKAIYGILRQAGVPKERIAYEFFGPATVLEADVTAANSATVPTLAQAAPVAVTASPSPPAAPARDWISLPPAAAEGSSIVTFARSGKAAPWDASADSLLAFAETQNLKPEFSCRSGVCGTCRTRLVEGEITYTDEPLDPPPEGEVLICCAKPKGAVTLDL